MIFTTSNLLNKSRSGRPMMSGAKQEHRKAVKDEGYGIRPKTPRWNK